MNTPPMTITVSFLLAAALYLVLGLVLLLWPGTTAAVICYAFGGILAEPD